MRWFKRNWNYFVFIPLAFVGGTIFGAFATGQHHPPTPEDGGKFTGAVLFWIIAAAVACFAYNRGRKTST